MTRRARTAPMFGHLGGAEVAVLTASVLVGGGILWFPSQLALGAGGGVEVAYLAEFALEVAAAVAAVSVVRRHGGLRWAWVLERLVPKSLGRALALALAALDVAVVAVTITGSGVAVTSAFLTMTPSWAVEFALLATSAYSAALGVESLARTLDLVAPVTWLGLVVEYALVATQARSGAALWPHVPHIGGWGAVWEGAYAGLWSLAGVSAVPNIAAHLASDQRPRVTSRVMSGVAISFLLQSSLLLLDLAVMGVVGIVWYEWPTVSMLREIRSQAFLLNRTGALAVPLMVVLVWSFSAIMLWNAAVLVRDALHLGAMGEGGASPVGPVHAALRSGPVQVGTLAAAVYALSLVLGYGQALNEVTSTWLDPVVLVLVFALLPVLAVLDRMRRRVRNRPAAAGGPSGA
ncbi:MAG: GerAB/ArcD/ProY family transporter [Firmicutes bacterium]|nr:GerAB/ArcD/ProY family transporter [Bacillota bacterium]